MREEAAKLANDICGLIEHRQAWIVMYALCSVMCAVHRSASTRQRQKPSRRGREHAVVDVGRSVMMTCALYRHYDWEGTLLYVGISLNAVARLSSHRRSGWFYQIRIVKVEHFASRQGALRAEDIAIKNEKPKYNIAGNAEAISRMSAAQKERRDMERLLRQPGPYENTKNHILARRIIQKDRRRRKERIAMKGIK